MVMFSPRREPEPDLRIQFAEYADKYPLLKRVEHKPGPCPVCGQANCTGDVKHGEQEQAVKQPPQWWLSDGEEDGGSAEE
jgi:hypothetical protein